MGKNKGNPALIELVIVIFFFSISSVTIVKLFMASYDISEKSKSETLAVIKMQDIAERFKAQPNAVAGLLEDWEKSDNRYVGYFDDELNMVSKESALYIIEITVDQQTMTGGNYIRLHILSYENTSDQKIVLQTNIACYVPEAAS